MSYFLCCSSYTNCLCVRRWWEALNLHHQTPSCPIQANNPCLCPCIGQDILDWRFAWTFSVWKMCGCFIYMFMSLCDQQVWICESEMIPASLYYVNHLVSKHKGNQISQLINSVMHALVILPLPAALRCALICSLSIPQGEHGFSKHGLSSKWAYSLFLMERFSTNALCTFDF